MTFGISATTALALGTVASGYMGAQAAKSAARTQARAADRAMAQEREMYDIARGDLAPYRELGYTALGDIENRIPFFTSQFGDEQLRQYLDPSMDFRRRLGEQTTARMLNVSGGAISGNTLRGLEEFGQNLASTEYGNAFNRFQNERTNIYNTLANIAGMGQQSVNTGVEAGQNFAGQQTGLLTSQAAALASGQVGAANAYGGAVQGLGNMYYLNQLMQRPPASAAVTNYSLSGGAPAAPGMGGGTGLTYSPATANQFFSAK
jgi:hypothetical protein